MADAITATEDALAGFRARVMADEALQAQLYAARDTDSFIDIAIRSRAADGDESFGEAIRQLLQPCPMVLVRTTAAPQIGPCWPPAPWLPMQIVAEKGAIYVDWVYVGVAPLNEPFFEGEIRRAMARPFNRLFRYRMMLADFLADTDSARQSLAPDGFIFHMSRCGSTLVSRMLAALPQATAISEAAPIDGIVQANHSLPALTEEQHAHLLRAIVAAFGRRRAGTKRRYFIKLDCWHTLALPLFARAFPNVPWIFLYRDPIEVLVSQIREPGIQTVPQLVSPAFYGIDGDVILRSEDYYARVLAAVCKAAINHAGLGRSLFVDYRHLPEAVWTEILPHFGIDAGEADRRAMQDAARWDAKSPSFEFSSDSQAKQREATPETHAAASRHLATLHAQLTTLRGKRCGAY
jgi:hypothetical protein